jgi:hypothetical protein
MTGTVAGERSETRRWGHRNRDRDRDRDRDRHDRTAGHEKRDLCRLPIGYLAWVDEKAETLVGVHRPAWDPSLPARRSISLTIAEGTGKTADADRQRYLETARGSGLVS